MPEAYYYLAINLSSIAIPLACSFEGRLQFFRKWKAVVPALLLPAIGFIVWDALFTAMGVWGFNPKYVTGIALGNMPVEEVLFFICIPYASLFTHVVLTYFVQRDVLDRLARPAGLMLLVLMATAALLFHDRLYTFWTALLLAAFLFVQLFVMRRTYWSRLVLTYLVILVPFFLVNGILTGTGLPEPIVWYNDLENLHLRMGTIPVEDAFYGFLLIGLNITVFEELQGK